MRVHYGANDTYVDVTSALLAREVDGVVDMTSIVYNEVFGDPCPGHPKKLVVEHHCLDHPITIAESTPFKINVGEIDVTSTPINIVYFINTRINDTYIHMMRSQLNDLHEIGLLSLPNIRVYVEVIATRENTDNVISEVKSLIPEAIVQVYEEDFFEYVGILRVWTLSQINPNNITLYFHSKGMSHLGNMTPDNCRGWMELPVFDVVIRRWRHNLGVLHLIPTVTKLGHSADYGGWIWNNFWWVKGIYLRHCEEPCKTRRRHYYEDWLTRYLLSPLPYSHIERPIIRDIYMMSTHDCYGYYSNSIDDPTHIGSVLRLDIDPNCPRIPAL